VKASTLSFGRRIVGLREFLRPRCVRIVRAPRQAAYLLLPTNANHGVNLLAHESRQNLHLLLLEDLECTFVVYLVEAPCSQRQNAKTAASLTIRNTAFFTVRKYYLVAQCEL
jgi:hypothetical protein